MTDLKKLLDTINKRLEGKTIVFVKHSPELVRRLDTEYSPGPLLEAFKAAVHKSDEATEAAVVSVKQQFEASIGKITHTWRTPILTEGPMDTLKLQAKKAVCQCQMRDLMSGVPHRSDCPERPGR